jgi:hypothetical protein
MTVKRLFSAVTGTAGSTATDGLDELRWRLLCKMVIAASTSDPTAAHRACSQLAQQRPSEPRDGHAAMYLWYLIRHRILEMLGQAPTEDDLHDLAVRFNPRFARIGRQDANLLERTLRTYYELSTLDDEVAGGLLVVAGTAALGVMLDNPRAQLKAMRPHLANWLRDNRDYLSGIGLLQNPADPPEPSAR